VAEYGQVTDGWLAVGIGVAEVMVLIAMAAFGLARAHRRGSSPEATETESVMTHENRDSVPYPRCYALIAEALVVQERVSGRIDAATYQARMHDLACGGRS